MSAATIQPTATYDLDPSDVAQYIVSLDSRRPEPDVTPLKLQKLLYLAQASYLAATGRRLFDADVEAFDNGPVVYPVYTEYKDHGRTVIAADDAEPEAPTLPSDAQRFVDQIWDRYADYSASKLWRLTHEQDPWKDFYEENAFRRKIPDSAMTEYFRSAVTLADRPLHPDVVALDQDVLDELDEDEDEIVAQAVRALR